MQEDLQTGSLPMYHHSGRALKRRGLCKRLIINYVFIVIIIIIHYYYCLEVAPLSLSFFSILFCCRWEYYIGKGYYTCIRSQSHNRLKALCSLN